MRHILEHSQIASEDIINDLLEEIKQTQKAQPTSDIAPMKAEIEKLKKKKRKAFDLMLEDKLSKDDLKEQADFYDSEIARLTTEIAENQDVATAHEKQLNGIRSYINLIGNAKISKADNIEIYHEIVKKVIVQENRVLDFYMNCVPFGFRIIYHTHIARMINKYDIFIDSCEIIA